MIKITHSEYNELPEVYKIVGKAFEKPAAYFKNFVEMNPYYKGDDFFIAKIDGKIVSAIQVLLREVYFNKERMLIGGIGQVATLPEYRGRGLAGKLLTACLEYMKKNKVDYSLLFAGPVPLYEKYGWKELPVKTLSLNVEYIKTSKLKNKYVVKQYRKNNNYQLFNVHNFYIKNFNSCVIRNTLYWNTYHDKFKAKDSKIFILEDNNKNTVAYLSVNKDGDKLNIMEYGAYDINNEDFFNILLEFVLNKIRVKEVFISAGNRYYIPYKILKQKKESIIKERTGFMVQNIKSNIDWKKSLPKLLFFPHDNF